MEVFAQTNIQLYNQMASSGYPVADIEAIGCAHRLATRIYVGKIRGSGKDLMAHVVGTASILVWLQRPVTTISAALLHAAIADGDFGTSSPAKEVTAAAGSEVWDLVSAYDELKWSHSSDAVQFVLESLPTAPMLNKEAALIRVANELEDYLDLATHYYGRPGEQGENFRITYMNEAEPALKELALELGYQQLAAAIEEQFKLVRFTPPISPRLRTGHHHMWMIHPPSGAPAFQDRARDLCKLTLRRMRRARDLGIRGTLVRIKEIRG